MDIVMAGSGVGVGVNVGVGVKVGVRVKVGVGVSVGMGVKVGVEVKVGVDVTCVSITPFSPGPGFFPHPAAIAATRTESSILYFSLFILI